MAKGFVSPWRFRLFAAGVLVAFTMVLGKLFFLHVVKHAEYAQEARDARQSLVTLEARRGNIHDANGNLLASTRPTIDLIVDPYSTRLDDAEKIPALADILGKPEAEIAAQFEREIVTGPDGRRMQKRWAPLARSISDDVYDRVQALEVAGVYGHRKYERYYPAEALGAQVIGYMGFTQDGDRGAVMGVERYMDFYLKGENGWLEIERDGDRRELSHFRHREVPPAHGLNVELTLDSVVQSYIEGELEHIGEAFNPDSATIIVSNPHTGFILGMGNWPSFNLNDYADTDPRWHHNRALTTVLEPGSTFKIVAAAGAIDRGYVTPDTPFNCGKSIVEYRGRKIRMPSDHKAMGVIPVRTIISKSSNRGAALLGMRLGDELMFEYAQEFGFGEQTGIGFGGEISGLLPEPEAWDGLTISRLPMGYAMNATPIQVHYAMATLANGGVLMKPALVRRVFDDHGNTIIAFEPEARRRAVDPSTAAIMAEMLVKTVSADGTAPKAEIPGYLAAGKTGTTRKLVEQALPNGRMKLVYTNQQHVASFSGFFPANRPRIVITVIVDNPKSTGPAYGGLIAAPSFKRVAERLIPYLAIQPVDNDTQAIAWNDIGTLFNP